MLRVADRPLSPADSLWLELLRREPDLKSLSSEEVRAKLKDQGFPDRIVAAFISEQFPGKKAAAVR
jgi:hypothetical protein